ncbi:MAG: hypothetical protein IPH96_17980 [Saprospiraceae bacterium]|nr:hypothetical protein [Saprospiraceae bacterium]
MARYGTGVLEHKGQLGNGSKMGALVPTQIGSDTDWKIVSGGGGFGFAGTTGSHYLALKTK